jgi:hypothetical protein
MALMEGEMKMYIYDTMFDPADDYTPWNVVKVYRDGNPIHLARFATEEEADNFVTDLEWEASELQHNTDWEGGMKP